MQFKGDIMNIESENLNDYLVSDPVVDWKTPDVLQTALNLTRSIRIRWPLNRTLEKC